MKGIRTIRSRSPVACLLRTGILPAAFGLAMLVAPEVSRAQTLLASIRFSSAHPASLSQFNPYTFEQGAVISGPEFDGEPGWLAMLLGGDILFTNPAGGNVLRYDQATLAYEGVFIAGVQDLSAPRQVAVAENGDVYVQDGADGGIFRFDGSGTLIGSVVPSLPGLFGLAFEIGPDGALWAVQALAGTTGIVRYDATTGDLLSVFEEGDALFRPGPVMTFSPDGSQLFVIGGDEQGEGKIARYDVATGTRTGLRSVGVTVFDPRDLVFGPDGNLYATGDVGGFVIIDPISLAEAGSVGTGNYTVAMLFVPPLCSDGRDNDGDGLVDLLDPGCLSSGTWPEDPPCDDGLDNDGDGLVDFDDPVCEPSWPYWEQAPCGLGAELVAALPLVMGLRRRRLARARG